MLQKIGFVYQPRVIFAVNIGGRNPSKQNYRCLSTFTANAESLFGYVVQKATKLANVALGKGRQAP